MKTLFKKTLCIVIITGLCTLSLCHTRQYHVIYEKRNWTDAQQYCREKFTDLATIDSLEDIKTLNDTVDIQRLASANPDDKYGAWIGLYNAVNSWRWSLAGERFYRDAAEHKFRNWAYGQPDNVAELCTLMYSNGEWHDYPCAEGYFAVCFKDIGSVPTGKYVLIEERLTWDKAQRYCRENYTDLASVRNQTENEEIRNIIGHNWTWIGLFRDHWKWSDGSSYSFSNWNIGEPNGRKENCAALEFGSGSKLADWYCERICAFICYSVPVKKQVLGIQLTKTNSSLDLNNHAVQEAILEQFKQSLKDKGETSDIKLRWVKQSDGKVFHKENKKREKKKRERKPVLTKREL